MDDLFEHMPPVRVTSPCINVCRIDPVTRTCEGCRRTLDEIARWTALTDVERAAIIADLPNRRVAAA